MRITKHLDDRECHMIRDFTDRQGSPEIYIYSPLSFFLSNRPIYKWGQRIYTQYNVVI